MSFPPEALADAYAFAAYLARNGSLDSPNFWFSKWDPVWRGKQQLPLAIIRPNQDMPHAPISPDFQGAPLAWAVALMPSASKQPAGTPLAWTRGLRSDGTWREDSIEYGLGGSIVFANCDCIHFAEKVDGKLHKYGTMEPTSNIFEALPPGTRISEYTPPPEVAGYAREMSRQQSQDRFFSVAGKIVRPLVFFLLVLGCSLALTHPRCVRELRLVFLIFGAMFAAVFWLAFWG